MLRFFKHRKHNSPQKKFVKLKRTRHKEEFLIGIRQQKEGDLFSMDTNLMKLGSVSILNKFL